METTPLAALSLVIKVVIRLIDYRYPSGVSAGYYLALVNALHELQDAKSYLNRLSHD